MSLPHGFELLRSLTPSLACELFTFEKTYLPHTVPITLFSTRLFTSKPPLFLLKRAVVAGGEAARKES